jgi:predicted GTPase
VSDPSTAPEIQAALTRLEQIAQLLESEGHSPQQMRDLADEALEIAQRVSGLLTETLSDAPEPPESGPTGSAAS